MRAPRYEPLWNQYGVDLLLFGHVHAYERTYPVLNYQADPTGCAPTYITIGEDPSTAVDTCQTTAEALD